MQPVIDILLGNPNAAWHQAETDVIIHLVNASVQLTLEHLTHRRGVSLLPSAEILIPSATGPGVDKLDNSAWLLQLHSLIIQMLQNSGMKLHDNKGSETPAGSTQRMHQELESREDQDVAGSCSSNSLHLADKVVATREILMCLLECLNQCPDKEGVLNSKSATSQEKLSADMKISGKPTSVEDGVLQLLSVVQSSITELGLLVDGILTYLQTPTIDSVESVSAAVKRLSDPLLWLLFKVLNSSEAVTQFYEKGES